MEKPLHKSLSSLLASLYNYDTIHYLDVTPTEDTFGFAEIGEGITDFAKNVTENTETKYYLINKGGATTSFTGHEVSFVYNGIRKIGNPVQEYVYEAQRRESIQGRETYLFVVTGNDAVLYKGLIQGLDAGGNTEAEAPIQITFFVSGLGYVILAVDTPTVDVDTLTITLLNEFDKTGEYVYVYGDEVTEIQIDSDVPSGATTIAPSTDGTFSLPINETATRLLLMKVEKNKLNVYKVKKSIVLDI